MNIYLQQWIVVQMLSSEIVLNIHQGLEQTKVSQGQ